MMKRPTLQEKYKFLCSKLRICDVDTWEGDALLELPEKIYFQFSGSPNMTINAAVIAAIESEKFHERVKENDSRTTSR